MKRYIQRSQREIAEKKCRTYLAGGSDGISIRSGPRDGAGRSGPDFLPRSSHPPTARALILIWHRLAYPPPSFSLLSSLFRCPLNTNLHRMGAVPPCKQTLHGLQRDSEGDPARDVQGGQNKGISKLPINPRISNPNVLDLRLADLPGLTRVGVSRSHRNCHFLERCCHCALADPRSWWLILFCALDPRRRPTERYRTPNTKPSTRLHLQTELVRVPSSITPLNCNF